jgi:uncharacterized protein (TIGR02271 family)
MTSMTKIFAGFDSRDAAEIARNNLLQLGLPEDRIDIMDQSSSELSERDRLIYQENIRRGGCLLAATVDDAHAPEAIARVEQAGPIDRDQREAQWRSEGWNPPAPDTNRRKQAGAQSNPDVEDEGTTIPVVEEELQVGKREVNRGSVRVRSYSVNEPVHEEVRLREEHVKVERRPVDAPASPGAKGSPEDPFQERTLEVSETEEQAVVGKEARVTEEVVVGKSTGERTERIDDTVRRTKVEVEDNRKGNKPGKSESSNRSRPR